MPQEITMPKLSDSMEEGRIANWLKKEGDRVAEGDVLAEIESDKAVMELECFYNGTLQKIVHPADDVVAVGEVIGIIAEAGEAAAREPKAKPAPAAPRAAPEAQKPAPSAAEEPAVAAVPPPVQAAVTKRKRKPNQIAASPLARQLAKKHGLDLSQLEGTGPSGRVVKRDVMAALEARPAAKAAAPLAPTAEEAPPAVQPGIQRRMERGAEVLIKKLGLDAAKLKGTGTDGRITVDDILAALTQAKPAAPGKGDEELPPISVPEGEADVEPVSYWQLTAARRTVASKHVIPHFYLTKTINATRLLALKNEKKSELGATVTHYILRACVKALQSFPQANWSYDRGKLVKWHHVNVGLAVQAEAGLVVGVVTHADTMTLKQLIEETAPLVERARHGRLKPEERMNPTFTVSNLGMFDVESFMAIINPPSACTLAVSSIVSTPVATAERTIEVADLMKMTISADHRLVDGVLAARLMGEIKRLLESPEELLG